MTEPSRPAPLVLVAEDDPDVLALVALRLERAGYAVVTAENGEQALARARERLPALAVLDVMMPAATGFEVAERLRGDARTKDIRVIFLTARVQKDDVARGFSVGADDYLEKPFDPQELCARVRAVLGARAA